MLMEIMNCKECRRKQSWPVLKYCYDIFLEGLSETTKIIKPRLESEFKPGGFLKTANE
jgi:hypothetical protein